MSGRNQQVSVSKQFPLSQKKIFFWLEHFSYIYWFSSSSFREYSQMCKATSNSNISWSKKWNLHLTASFNNVQSPFNRKMEQSANRKRKGLIKTHQPRADDTPTMATRHMLSLAEHKLCSGPQSVASTDKFGQNQSRSTKGKYFSWRSGVLAITIHFLFVKENECLGYVVMNPLC